MKLFLWLVLIVSFLTGCSKTQSVIETYKNEYLQTLIDLDKSNRAYQACDTNYQTLWFNLIDCMNDSTKIDTIKNDFWRDVYFVPTDSIVNAPQKKLIKELQKSDTVYVYKGIVLPGKLENKKIIYKIHPITWVFAIATLIFVIAFIILFLLTYKIVKNGTNKTGQASKTYR